ncbi:uncharacterized protein LOC114522838 [Dendronephthya gigantea]|uniref:uncharacterized protein LOC114522838 n=1 Tax=Dendronephthya gigantea TaxID=151771 RepID=UPI00106AF79B|nr:uncharacterized protein LOC114522838 [Dendronephthya gigantea]
MSCRSVRHAVEISDDGDEIYINHVLRRPYMECENTTEAKASSIQLKRSISFHGVNGTPIISCKKSYTLFAIKNTSLAGVNVGFYNLVLHSANTAVECDEATAFEVIIENTTFTDNLMSVHSKSSTNCGVKINNSVFQGETNWAIWLRCTNLTAHIANSVFKRSPILLRTTYNEHHKRSQTVEVLVRQSIFDGQYRTLEGELFFVSPYAVSLIVSIWSSSFLNHRGLKDKNSLLISDCNADKREITYIALRDVNVENNFSPAKVVVSSSPHASFKVEIMNSIFRNNSGALVVQTVPYNRNRSLSKIPVFLYNNTFMQNYHGIDPIKLATSISFLPGKYQVSSCRFYDNMAGKNPFSAVVTVSQFSNAVFLDCYFENRQIISAAAQFYARGGSSVSFTGKNTFNITALNTGQAIFVRIPFQRAVGIVLKGNFKILCPQGYVLHSQKVCNNSGRKIYCAYVYITCEKCPPKTYAITRGQFTISANNNITCKPCPRGGSCLDGVVKASPNFWGYKANASIKFAQCPPGYCCDSKDCVSYDSCHGNRTGTLCGHCASGMSDGLFSSSCISNAKCSVSLFIPSVLAILVLYLIFFLYHVEIERIIAKNLFGSLKIFTSPRIPARTPTNERNRRGGLIKVVFYYYQVVRLIQGTVGSQKRNRIFGNLEDFIARILNMVLVDTALLNCPFQSLEPVQKAAILHSVGYFLLGLLAILYIITVLVQRLRKFLNSGYNEMRNIAASEEARHSWTFKARIASAFTYISLLMYASSTQLCLSLLHCVPVGNNQVLFLDGNVKCYQTFQYILLAYVVSSVFPFCLVPVLGAYLLKMNRISVAQFCVACIFPLPFCCFWIYLVLKEYRWQKRAGNDTREPSENFREASEDYCVESSSEDRPIQQLPEQVHCQRQHTHNGCQGQIREDRPTCESGCKIQNNEAILRVLLGPFRNHKAFLCFPDSVLPWEGYLIFRRLVLIIVLTFVHDNRLKMMLTLTLCVAILASHMYIKPFTLPSVNAIESLSLSVLTVFCGFTLIKSLYYGEDFSSLSDNVALLNLFNTIENILVVAPLAILLLIVVLSVLGRLLVLFRKCLRYCRK